jgi:prephenate dehydrogenase
MGIKNISIIGLGLIGGSIAKALKLKDESLVINAYDREKVCAAALAEKIIDNSLPHYTSSLDSELIILALPIEESLKVFKELAPGLKSGCILTDVCSVKGVFESLWQELDSRGVYFGGHPMAGKESGGYENSDPYLFENAVYAVSDKAVNNPAASGLISIIESLGARVKFLDPYIHDRAAAYISHLPQTVAVSLVNSLPPASDNLNFTELAGGGFRDMTRIASSDFTIWESIYKHNKEEILASLEKLQDKLAEYSGYIKSEEYDKLRNEFLLSSQTRNAIPKNAKGFLRPLYDIFVYAKDEPGAINGMSTALYARNINIKDIELLKIREGEGGAFRLGFASKEEADKAKAALKENGFRIT